MIIPDPADNQVLVLTGNEGSFLIRESESKPGQYALSIRTGEIVKHYSIRTLDAGGTALCHHRLWMFFTVLHLVRQATILRRG